MVVKFLKGYGFNIPHIYPRATEFQIVIQGVFQIEMISENEVFNKPGDPTSNCRVIKNIIN